MFRAVQYLFLLLGLGLFISCGTGATDNKTKNSQQEENDDEVETYHRYGLKGKYDIATPWEESENNMSVVYYPSNISKKAPTPVIFFAPGWKSVHHQDYQTLLTFIASHGYSVIYAKDDLGAYSSKHLIKYFNEMIYNSEVEPYIDLSRIGVIGHSSGGGHAFKILKEFTNQGWGSNASFLFILEPWFAFDMNKSDIETLPSNSNVVMIQFGKGGENLENNTDPRIPLSEYYLLTSIDEDKKDYQVVENANHLYPEGNKSYSEMQGILKPLDALMEYSFNVSKDVNAHHIALELGSPDPYNDGHGIQKIKETDSYHYRCDGDDNSGAIRTLVNTDIDYCAMER